MADIPIPQSDYDLLVSLRALANKYGGTAEGVAKKITDLEQSVHDERETIRTKHKPTADALAAGGVLLTAEQAPVWKAVTDAGITTAEAVTQLKQKADDGDKAGAELKVANWKESVRKAQAALAEAGIVFNPDAYFELRGAPDLPLSFKEGAHPTKKETKIQVPHLTITGTDGKTSDVPLMDHLRANEAWRPLLTAVTTAPASTGTSTSTSTTGTGTATTFPRQASTGTPPAAAEPGAGVDAAIVANQKAARAGNPLRPAPATTA